MIKSMTGYGRGEAEGPDLKWVVELKSLNHRFLELSLNLPRHLWALEDRLRKLIKSRITRGRVEMQLSWETMAGKSMVILKLDPGLLAETRSILQELLDFSGLPEPLRLEHFLHFSETFVTKERETLDMEDTWALVSRAVSGALEALEQMRLSEGEAMAAEMAGHLEVLRQERSRIAAQAALLPQLYQERLTARLAELLQPGTLDESRIAQEVALMAERRDLAEELARLESHLAQFQQNLEAQGPSGRQLEFLLQEMLREVNTIGAKAGDLLISQAVLTSKGALERLREQVQNIE
jgi:uncharacterized protein (TIGR00255 family)